MTNQLDGLFRRPAIWTVALCAATLVNCGVLPFTSNHLKAQDDVFGSSDDDVFGSSDPFGETDLSDDDFGFGSPDTAPAEEENVSDLSKAETMEPKPAPPPVDLTPVDETLIKAWQGQIRVGNGGSTPIGFELHAHSFKRLQIIRVKVGERLVASFNADDFSAERVVSTAGSNSRSSGSGTRGGGSSGRPTPSGGSSGRPTPPSAGSGSSSREDTGSTDDDIFGSGDAFGEDDANIFDDGADVFGEGSGTKPTGSSSSGSSSRSPGSDTRSSNTSRSKKRTTFVAAKPQGSGTREEGSSSRSSDDTTASQTAGSDTRSDEGSGTRSDEGSGTRSEEGSDTRSNEGSGSRSNEGSGSRETAGSNSRANEGSANKPSGSASRDSGSGNRNGSGTKEPGSNSRPEPNPATMTVGFKNAMARADRIVDRLEILGKQPNVEMIDRPMTFLATTSSDGFVQVMNAETGEVLWNAAVGSPSRKTFAAKMSDDYLSVVNGQQLYVFDLISGRLLNERTLKDIPGASPTPIGDWIVVPSFRGGVTCYSATDLEQLPWKQRFGGNMYDAATASHDRRFIAWPTTLGHVYLAEMNSRAKIWNRLETRGEIATSPIPVDNGFVIASTRGNIIRISHPTETSRQSRETGLIWKHNAGVNVSSRVLSSSDTVAMVTRDNELKTISLATGRPMWDSPTANVTDVLAMSATRIYVKTSNRKLGVVDKLTGEPIEVFPGTIANGFHNSLNDRVYLYDAKGQISCYHERGRPEPLQHFTAVGRTFANDSASNGLAEADAAGGQSESDAGSTFGFGDADAPLSVGNDDLDDPFGTGASDDSDDVFDIFN